jgi:nicotinamidase-related amidase
MTRPSLIEAEDSLLIVVDIQPSFVRKESREGHDPLLQRMCWVIKVANWLNVPMVVTAEDIPRKGDVSDEVAEILPPGTKVFNKMSFGLAAQADILEAVRRTLRRTAVFIGYETDVCIMQSALGLLDLGYRIVVVSDATGSPGGAHQLGLDRIRGAGGIIVGAKSLYYEWIRTVERSIAIEGSKIPTPEGIVL